MIVKTREHSRLSMLVVRWISSPRTSYCVSLDARQKPNLLGWDPSRDHRGRDGLGDEPREEPVLRGSSDRATNPPLHVGHTHLVIGGRV